MLTVHQITSVVIVVEAMDLFPIALVVALHAIVRLLEAFRFVRTEKVEILVAGQAILL